MDKQLARRTARRLSDGVSRAAGIKAMVGLDAFVDEIARVVDKRSSDSEFSTIGRIHELGARITGASGQSTNLELVVERVKLGGNGPIMANALAALGPDVTCIGPFGEPDPHPAFAEIVARARVVSIGQPAHTDALEFEDGKLMVGKLETLNDVTWERIQHRLGGDATREAFVSPGLVALVNWTMIPAMSQIWEQALGLLVESGPTDSVFFFDLADPEKHDEMAIASAARLLARFQPYRRTILGLNEKEAFLVGRCLGYRGNRSTREDIRLLSAYISASLPISAVVVHPRAYAVVAAGGQVTADVDGPFTDNPLISTGAGDHFNAGFCLAILLGLTHEEAAAAAVATSGYYVRNAASPSLAELATFLAQLGD